jgi:hypothetical protein
MFEIETNPVSVNCQVCGSEHLEAELKTVKLSGFNESMVVCEICLNRTAEDSFTSAAELLEEVVFIARATSGNPERRIKAIKELLGV